MGMAYTIYFTTAFIAFLIGMYAAVKAHGQRKSSEEGEAERGKNRPTVH